MMANVSTGSGDLIGNEPQRAVESLDQPVVQRIAKPLSPNEGLVIPIETLSPERCVMKIVGHEQPLIPASHSKGFNDAFLVSCSQITSNFVVLSDTVEVWPIKITYSFHERETSWMKRTPRRTMEGMGNPSRYSR